MITTRIASLSCRPAGALALLAGALLGLPAQAQPEARPATGIFNRTWTADNGNGTFTNPIFYDEFSDPDLIRGGVRPGQEPGASIGGPNRSSIRALIWSRAWR